jgi:hypothetical protein
MSVIVKCTGAVALGVALASCASSSRLGSDLPLNPEAQGIETPQQNQTKQAKKRPQPRTNAGTQVSEPANKREVSSGSGSGVSSASAGEE